MMLGKNLLVCNKFFTTVVLVRVVILYKGRIKEKYVWYLWVYW